MRIGTHLTITETEAKLLDEILEQTPFESRTDFLTACVHVLLYKSFAEESRDLDPTANQWTLAIREIADTQDKIRTGFFELMKEFGIPILAMRGRKAAIRILKHDLIHQMMIRFGEAPGPETLAEWIKIFEEIHLPEITAHRTEILKQNYFQENVQ